MGLFSRKKKVSGSTGSPSSPALGLSPRMNSAPNSPSLDSPVPASKPQLTLRVALDPATPDDTVFTIMVDCDAQLDTLRRTIGSKIGTTSMSMFKVSPTETATPILPMVTERSRCLSLHTCRPKSTESASPHPPIFSPPSPLSTWTTPGNSRDLSGPTGLHSRVTLLRNQRCPTGFPTPLQPRPSPSSCERRRALPVCTSISGGTGKTDAADTTPITLSLIHI